MKKPKRKKPKFYKGQVVVCRFPKQNRTWFGKIKRITASTLFHLEDAEGKSICFAVQSELRPLAAKEIGPRRELKQ